MNTNFAPTKQGPASTIRPSSRITLRPRIQARRLGLSLQTLLVTLVDAINGATRAPVASRQKSATGSTAGFWQIRERGNNMEYVIVFGVATMVGLYTLIIRRCLRDA